MLPRSFALVTALALLVACAKQQPGSSATVDTSKAAIAADLQHADKARIQGSDNAKVWLVMASDFQCPFCRAFHDSTYPLIVKNYIETGKIRAAFINHPGVMHPFAVVSAEAAMCAGVQDRFWPMHEALFATQGNWARSSAPVTIFDSLANALQLRMPEWRHCMSSHETRAMIDADNAKTIASGVTGTPSFFVENKLVIVGAEEYPKFRAAIDSALARAGPPTGGR